MTTTDWLVAVMASFCAGGLFGSATTSWALLRSERQSRAECGQTVTEGMVRKGGINRGPPSEHRPAPAPFKAKP